MPQRYRISGAVGLAVIGLVLLLYTQTLPGHAASGPCTFAQGLIHCSAPYHRSIGMPQSSSHPLLPLGLVLLALSAGVGVWAIRATRPQAQADDANE